MGEAGVWKQGSSDHALVGSIPPLPTRRIIPGLDPGLVSNYVVVSPQFLGVVGFFPNGHENGFSQCGLLTAYTHWDALSNEAGCGFFSSPG